VVAAHVTKCKIRSLDAPTPYYCLTVPAYHNFALANGVVSKNCHINSLLLTLFAKYMPSLFDRKLIYVAMTPQFYAIQKSSMKLFIGATPKEVEDKCKAAGLKLVINHIKGYGEVDADILRLLAFDPKTRTLAEVQPWKDAKDKDEFILIMGESPEGRRKLLELGV
jgi:DNA gyrase/topoisomerase IV subunit B